MAYDFQAELKRVTDYYNGDPLQKRFSALISGETNAGKTYMLRTARKPIHIDSFDPGGTKCLTDLIKSGDVIADTRWETEDPYRPSAFAEWMKTTEIRMKMKYFDNFGTYAVDSLSTFGDAVMNYGMNLKQRAGETPSRNKDYNPQKVYIVNKIRMLMNLPCDFILTAHLREIEEIIGTRQDGSEIKKTKYRLNVTGQAVMTLPLLFDELYVIIGTQGPNGPKREMLIDSLGTYIARSRLKKDGKQLNAKEEPDIKKLLQKTGFDNKDKPKLDTLAKDESKPSSLN